MPAESNVRDHIGAQGSTRAGDRALAELADRQHGVVARAQLVELGLGRGAIARRLERMRLRPLHRGVYAVGHRGLSKEGWWLAAVLACGAEAVLSHRSAAALWAIRPGGPSRVEVSAPRQLAPREAIAIRTARVPLDERTGVDGIPVTTVPRTLLDLAAVLDREGLRRALEQAEALRLSDPLSLQKLLARHRGRRGVAALRAVLEDGAVRPAATRSELERRFLGFAERAGLPRGEVNAWLQVEGHALEVDCLWRRQRLVVELDGRAFHDTRAAFERDRARDRRLHAAGWRVVRITDAALRRESDVLAADLHRLLAA